MAYSIMTYSINNIYPSVISNGYHAGVPAIVIRFAGCNMKCSTCDTDFLHALPPMEEQEIIEYISMVRKTRPIDVILLTGGEPMLQCASLLPALKREGFLVHLETNGSIKIPKEVRQDLAWVSVSPKPGASCSVKHADEVRVEIGPRETPHISPGEGSGIRASFWYLVPKPRPAEEVGEEASYRISQACLNWCYRQVVQNRGWRMSPQLEMLGRLWKAQAE